MTNNRPLISICIPTYNGEQFIAEAMDSAISQSYPNLEIVISDDASVDSTLDIIETYRTKTTIPIHIFHHEPRGIGANWNYSIQQANGVYIKFLFQDDVLKPTCIEKMVHVLEQNPSFGLVACKRDFIVEPTFLDENSDKWISIYGDLQKMLDFNFTDGLMFINQDLFSDEKFFESPMNKVGEPTTILFRRDLIDAIGYFREDLNQVLDYEFCYRVLKHQTIAIINEVLVQFRLHGNQTTVNNKSSDVYAKDHAIYEKIIYSNYYRFLSPKIKKRLARKYNNFVSMFYDTKYFIRKVKRKKW